MKRKPLLLFFAVLMLFALSLPAQTAWARVTQKGDSWVVDDAEGFAPIVNGNISAAREEAKLAAYRDALEKAIGAIVTGVTEMENFAVVRDKVWSQAQGIVKNFDIIREKTDDDILSITGICTVVENVLDGVLGPAILDAIGNPRLMVLIDEMIGDRFPFLSTTEGLVLGVFEKAGFLLVDPDQARALLNINPKVAFDDPVKLMDTARTLNADVIIVGRAYGSEFTKQKINNQTLTGVRSTIQLKAVLTKTAYQLGSQVVEKIAQGLNEEQGAAKAFQAAAPEAASSIVYKVAYAMASGGGLPGKTAKAIISGVSFSKSEEIIEKLREFAGKSGGVYERAFTNGVLEVDVISERNVRSVASFISSELELNVSNIDGQIIYCEVEETPGPGPEPAPAALRSVTVRITDVPSFNEAGDIEDALREMIGQGEVEIAGYKDKVLELAIVSGKSARDIAAFLSKKEIEITGVTQQGVEGKLNK